MWAAYLFLFIIGFSSSTDVTLSDNTAVGRVVTSSETTVHEARFFGIQSEPVRKIHSGGDAKCETYNEIRDDYLQVLVLVQNYQIDFIPRYLQLQQQLNTYQGC